MKNLYGEAARGYDGSTSKINLGGTYYGRTWSEEDQAHYDLYLKSLEFDQNRMLQLDERRYNSPVQQVARMREAGLNPDLQSISPDQSPSMSMTSPAAPAGQSDTDRAVKIGGLAQDFLSLLPQAVNLVNSIQGGIINVQNMKFSQLNEGSKVAREDFLNSITSDWFDKDGQLLPDVRDNISRYVSTSAHIFPGSAPRKPTRFEKAYWNELQRLVNSSNESLKDMRYGRGFSAERNRQNFLSLIGAHGANLNDDSLVKILREYNEIVFEADKASHKATRDEYDANAARKFKADGSRMIEDGDYLTGTIMYIIGMLMDANLTASRSNKGFSFGFSK